MSVMRSSLIGSLLQVLKFNQDRKAERLRVFEIGRVFMRDASVADSDSTVAGVHQPLRVAALASGPLDPAGWAQDTRAVDFFDVKGDLEALLAPLRLTFEPCDHPALHPGRSARVIVDGNAVGVVGQLHPRWRQSYELAFAPVLFELDLQAVLQRPVPSFAAVNRQQVVERDIAVIVPEAVTHDQLMRHIHAAPTRGLLRSATLFDVYRPKQAGGGLNLGEKSLAVRLVLCDDQATLTDEQIDQSVHAVLDSLRAAVGARLRA
jgi:phenylalanyl-tRNA synthetase beta chain